MAGKGDKKTGGRQKGSLNKRTTALAEAVKSQLADLPEGYKEPLQIMMEVANTPAPMSELSAPEKLALALAIKTDPMAAMELINLKLSHHKIIMDAAKNAAPYRHARLASSEVSGSVADDHIAAVNERMLAEQPEGEGDE